MAAVDIDNFIDPKIIEEVTKLAERLVELNQILDSSIQKTSEYKKITSQSSDSNLQRNYDNLISSVENLNRAYTERINVERDAKNIISSAANSLKDQISLESQYRKVLDQTTISLEEQYLELSRQKAALSNIRTELKSLNNESKKGSSEIIPGQDDLNSLIEREKTLTRQIQQRRDTLKDASDETYINGVSVEFYRNSLESLEAQLKKVQDEQQNHSATLKEFNANINESRMDEYLGKVAELTQKETQAKLAISELTSSIKAQEKELRAAEGSYDQQNQRLGQARDLWRSLSGEQLKAADTGGVLISYIQELEKSVREHEEASGNFHSNVGNYAKGYQTVTTEIRNMQREILGLKNDITNIDSVIDQQVSKLQNLAQTVGKESEEYKNAERELANLNQAKQAAIKVTDNLTKEAANLQREWREVVKETKNLSSATKNVTIFNQGIETLTAGFTAYRSILSAVGIENENIIELFARLQVVQQGANAVMTIARNLNRESAIGAQLYATWIKIVTAFKEAKTKATITETAAETANTAATRANTTATAAQATATTTAAAASTGFSVSLRAVGAAIKAIPGVGWLLAIVSGLIAAGAVITRLVNSTKELTGEMRMQLELENDRATIRSKVIDQTVEENNYLRIQLGIINSVNQGTAEWYNALANIENIIGKLNDGQKANAQTISESVDQYQNLNKSILTANAALQQANENEQRANEQVLALQQKINEAMFQKVKLSQDDKDNLQNILGYERWQVDLTQKHLNYLTRNGKRYREIVEKQQQGVALTKEEVDVLRNVEGRIRVINTFLGNGTELIREQNNVLLEGIEEQIAANDKLQKQREASIGLDDDLRDSNAKAQDAINRNNTASLRERARQIREHYEKEIFPLYDKDSQEYKKHLQIMNNDLADINRQIVENNRKTQDSIFQMRLRYFDTIAETEIDKMRLQILRLQDQNKKIAQQYGERSKIAIASEEYTQAAIEKLNLDFLRNRTDEVTTALYDFREELLKGSEAQYQELERLGNNFLEIGIKNENDRLKLQEDRMRQQFLNERELLDKEIEIYGKSYEAYKEINGEKVISEEQWIQYRESALTLLRLKEEEFLKQVENATEVSERNKQQIRQKYLDAQLAMISQRYTDQENQAIIDAGANLTIKQERELQNQLGQIRIEAVNAQIAEMDRQKAAQSEYLGSTEEYFKSLGTTEELWNSKYKALQAQETQITKDEAERRKQVRLSELKTLENFANTVTDSFISIGNALSEGLQNEQRRIKIQKQLALAQVAIQQGLATAYAITAATKPGGSWITAAAQIVTAIGTITTHFIRLRNTINSAPETNVNLDRRITYGRNELTPYAEGTLNHPGGGPVLTGEAGPEIVNIPGLKPFIVDKPTIFNDMKAGSQVIPFDKIPDHYSTSYGVYKMEELFSKIDSASQKADVTNKLLSEIKSKPNFTVNVGENVSFHLQKGISKTQLLNQIYKNR